MHTRNNAIGWQGWPFQSDEYGCHSPLRDIVAPPLEPRSEFVSNTDKLSLEELIAGKKELFFFSGAPAPGLCPAGLAGAGRG